MDDTEPVSSPHSSDSSSVVHGEYKLSDDGNDGILGNPEGGRSGDAVGGDLDDVGSRS